MTNNNSKYKLEATFTYLQGNLNNSSFIGSRRSILSSSLHPSFVTGFTDREGSFGVFARRVPNPNVIYFSLYRYYIIGPRQVKPHILLDRVTEAVNEYNSNCFYISVYKSNKLKLGEGVTLVFYISLKDEKLVRRLQLALGGCGQVLKINDSFIFRVQDTLSINKQILPFFYKSNLQGKKLLAFEYWKKVAYLMSHKAHSNPEGLNDIKKIKLLMNNVKIQEHFGLVLYGSNLSSTVGSPALRNWKSFRWDQLSSSGNILKLLVPNYNQKILSGWGNQKLLGTIEVVFHYHSCKVKSQMMTERVIDNRGSKSTIVRTLPRNISVLILSVVKEQRVDGSWQEKYNTLLLSRCFHSCLRYILMDLEINCQIKILSKLSSIKKKKRWAAHLHKGPGKL